MKIFARPNKAFFAFERMLSRKPRSWPPTTHDAPTLWGRARQLCAETIDFVRTAAALAERWRIGRNERREILNRLVPVEVLVRTLLLVEAATFLLTPEGQRLRAATSTVIPPAPPPPVGVRKPTHKITIEMPGWRTIAALRPRIDPRVVERERREALERSTQPQEMLAAPAPPEINYANLSHVAINPKTSSRVEAAGGGAKRRSGPSAKRADAALRTSNDTPPHGARGFTILHWAHDTSDIPPLVRPPKRRVSITLLGEDSNFNLAGDIVVIRPRRARRNEGPCAALARRIDALARVIANPAPVIRRLARQLAALPHDNLPEMFLGRARSFYWWHGRPEAHNASALAVPLFKQLAEPPPVRPPEPG
jgi:hypothetical protein